MYGKIYEQTFTGSMVGNGSHVFAVWAYVIAHTKPDSMVELNPVIIATILGDDVQRIKTAIATLCAPDPDSRSKDDEGRRLVEKAPFLYFVPQFKKYAGIPNERERRQYFAQKQRDRRARLKAEKRQTVTSKTVKSGQSVSPAVTHSDSDSDSDSDIVFTKVNTHPVSALEIYKAYPRKVAKPAALRAIEKAMMIRPAAELLKLTVAFAATQIKNDPFTPHPATWFNQQRFADDPETWICRNGRDSLSPAERRQAEIHQANREYHERKRERKP